MANKVRAILKEMIHCRLASAMCRGYNTKIDQVITELLEILPTEVKKLDNPFEKGWNACAKEVKRLFTDE